MRVETLPVQLEINPQRLDLGEEADKLLQAAAEPVDAHGRDGVELTVRSDDERRVAGADRIFPADEPA